jgi:hypothetical protein
VWVRTIEPTTKADSLRVIKETGVIPVSYPTLNRRLTVFAKPTFRQGLATACATRNLHRQTSPKYSRKSTAYVRTSLITVRSYIPRQKITIRDYVANVFPAGSISRFRLPGILRLPVPLARTIDSVGRCLSNAVKYRSRGAHE